MSRATNTRLWVLTALVFWLALIGCDDDPEGDAGNGGDGDGDVDGDADADFDREPPGQDCLDDHESCPQNYECACGGPGPGPWPCWCGLMCDDANDCTEPLQPICCFGTCTDRYTCY